MPLEKNCGCKGSILVVDDYDANIFTMEQMLGELFGIEIDWAMDGEEAVRKVKLNILKDCCDERYRLVFMDINMPVLDGYGATEQILALIAQINDSKSIKEPVEVPVVAVTSFDNEGNIRRCFDVGMKEVLNKPVACKEL